MLNENIYCNDNAFSIDYYPFPLFKINNFLIEYSFNALRYTMMNFPYIARNNDLYEFRQTSIDLKHINHAVIHELCNALYSERFVNFLEKTLSFPPNSLSRVKVDISGQKYTSNNYLLCHDDRLDTRRVALMIYLTAHDKWAGDMGGLLERFEVDPDGQPIHNRQNVHLGAFSSSFSFPLSNTAAFFEVTPFSYHQVTLLGKNITQDRFSITCWFHDSNSSMPLLQNLLFYHTLPDTISINSENLVWWATSISSFEWATRFLLLRFKDYKLFSDYNQKNVKFLGKPVICKFSSNCRIYRSVSRLSCKLEAIGDSKSNLVKSSAWNIINPGYYFLNAESQFPFYLLEIPLIN